MGNLTKLLFQILFKAKTGKIVTLNEKSQEIVTLNQLLNQNYWRHYFKWEF